MYLYTSQFIFAFQGKDSDLYGINEAAKLFFTERAIGHMFFGMSQYSESTKRALLSYPIVGVLAALGKRTDRLAGSGFLFSPLRDERHPSFQINASDNVWTDWGTGEKGGVIDLVCRLRGCTRYEAMDFLASLGPYPEMDRLSCRSLEKTPELVIDSDKDITSTVLIRYACSRGIDARVLKRLCREVRFHFVRSGVSFYSIGFRTDAGGWVLRNGMQGRASKIASAPGGPSTFDRNLHHRGGISSESVYVLEGFMDLLSLLMLRPLGDVDVCVLNSGANIPSAIPFISSHRDVFLLLDNDPAGDVYTDRIRTLCPGSRHLDCRESYHEYNDLNDLLLGYMGVRKPSCHQKAQDNNQYNAKTIQL